MKKIILTESQIEILKNVIAKQGNQYSYSPEKVLIVKKYLDDNFSHDPEDVIEGIGADGFATSTPISYLFNRMTGKKVKPFYDYQLLELLCTKFENMFTDENEKTKFLGQVVKDWYNNKIGLYGSLSVNHL